MAQRYGRNQKRRHREQLLELQRRMIECQAQLFDARQRYYDYGRMLARIAKPELELALQICGRAAGEELGKRALEALAREAPHHTFASVREIIDPKVPHPVSIVRVEVDRVQWSVVVKPIEPHELRAQLR